MTAKKGLAEYRRRGDFSKTTEPKGSGAGTATEPDERPSFVVQIHDTTALHFDFRLAPTNAPRRRARRPPGVPGRRAPDAP
ncbi:hypothetical protein OHA59_49305 [Streptomyces sp. NBC_01589]|uniref:hypothetical protein n=1 Tax=Streptomyces sp. NBC_01589 TaxID=2975886 RepID=UPI003866A636